MSSKWLLLMVLSGCNESSLGPDAGDLAQPFDPGDLSVSGIDGPPASCTDRIKNGDESDVDCGGTACAPCAVGRACTMDSDCVSHTCTMGVCAACGLGHSQPPSAPAGGTVFEADADGDGRIDLLQLGPESLGVAVNRNLGDDHFDKAVSFSATASTQKFVAVADLDGDARPDAVMVSNTDPTVSVLLNQGGVFPTSKTLAAGKLPTAVAIADLDGDGNLDLVVSNQLLTSVGLLYGKGQGLFADRVELDMGGGYSAVVVADFDGDAKPDIAFAQGTSLGLLLNQGGRAFGARADFVANAAAARDFRVTDINGDGKPDLAILIPWMNSAPSVVRMLLNRTNAPGNPMFSVAIDTPVGKSNSIGIGNLDGDHRPELTTRNEEVLTVWRGPGDGTWKASESYLTGGMANGTPVIGDLNGDGKSDVAASIGGQYFFGMMILTNLGGGLLAAPRVFPAALDGSFVAAGDLSGDGRPDVVVTDSGTPGAGTVNVLLNQGAGLLEPLVGYPTADGPAMVAIGELGGDASPDLAVACVTAGVVSVLINQGGAHFAAAKNYPVIGAVALAIGDLDGDGVADLAVASQMGGVSVLKGQGGGRFAAAVLYPTLTRASSVAIGDLDGDLKPDLAVSDYTASVVSVLFNRGDGTFGPKSDHSVGSRPSAVAIADADGDGWREIFAATQGGSMSVLTNMGHGQFGQAGEYDMPGGFAGAVGDVDGDGRPDLVAAGSSAIGVRANLGGHFPNRVDYSSFIFPRGVAFADFDGDGRVDLTSTDSQRVAIFLNHCW